MKILDLKLKNFKGILNFTLDTQGDNVSILGDNATGKTTLFDAFLWLLFDKDSQNKKDFDIKTLDASGKAFSNLEHEVEGSFEIGGKTLTLRKVYAEQWTRKRGAATSTFTGHTIDHFINAVPVKKGEYVAQITKIAEEGIFKLLTSPAYFNEHLLWQERRKILLEVCGDISDEDVIASNKSLAKLPDILNDRKLDDHRKVIKARQTEINDELKKIPVRIDEATKGLPDIAGVDTNEVTGKINVLKNRVKDKNAEITRIQGGGEVAEKTKTLREVEGRILDIRNKHRADADRKVQGKRTELNKVKDAASDLQRRIQDNQRTIAGNKNLAERAEAKAAKLREEWFEVNNEQFEFNQETVCPTCGQALPEEKLNAAREKALANFNRGKATTLEDISKGGKQHKVDAEKLRAENESLEVKVSDMETERDAARIKEETLLAEIDTIAKESGDITENPAYAKAVKEKESLMAAIDALDNGNVGQTTGIKAEITMLENEMAECEKALAQVDQFSKGQKRIEELKAQEKVLAAEFEKLEGELYLVDQFTKAKVAMLDEKINSKFKLARFKMFNEQINGGIEPCCETLYGGVPYSSGLNNGHRGIVGLDIISTLSEHYGFFPPIFYDNAESVTKLPEMKSQMICLYVSEQDKKLRVVLDTETKNDMREAV